MTYLQRRKPENLSRHARSQKISCSWKIQDKCEKDTRMQILAIFEENQRVNYNFDDTHLAFWGNRDYVMSRWRKNSTLSREESGFSPLLHGRFKENFACNQYSIYWANCWKQWFGRQAPERLRNLIGNLNSSRKHYPNLRRVSAWFSDSCAASAQTSPRNRSSEPPLTISETSERNWASRRKSLPRCFMYTVWLWSAGRRIFPVPTAVTDEWSCHWRPWQRVSWIESFRMRKAPCTNKKVRNHTSGQ